MSALAVAGPGRGWEDAGRSGVGADGAGEDARPAQPRLFALPGGAVEESGGGAVAAEPAGAMAPVPEAKSRAAAPVRTLDDALTGVWLAISTGATAACPLCAGSLRTRWSAGAGAVGGRCEDCGTVVE